MTDEPLTLAVEAVSCDHCGEDCIGDYVTWQEQPFCCSGCATVYQLLNSSGLGRYYAMEDTPGLRHVSQEDVSWAYLDHPDVVSRLLDFQEGGIARITFTLPQIHCSSCLWLLERLWMIEEGIRSSKVDFIGKKASITYDTDTCSLRKVVELLASIGYTPELHLGQLEEGVSEEQPDRTLLYQLGLAGFAFGNIMLLSFPEYLGLEKGLLHSYVGYLNIGLTIPVLLYSGKDYLGAAIQSLRLRTLNINVPIAIGIITLFSRSVYDIISLTGMGYLDSLTGLIFFLLIGKWFQRYTYRSLDFDRNYKSYFPIATLHKPGSALDGDWCSAPLVEILPGDHLLIKNQELIPTDAVILKGQASIDYSFVTGESEPVSKGPGDHVYAGGKQIGSSLELCATKAVDQSYLTDLWNEDIFTSGQPSTSGQIISVISRYFTITILSIAAVTFAYWSLVGYLGMAFNATTAVLIVACPCALALAIPFTYGNILRILSRSQLYLRNVSTIEEIQDIDHIVFDKTGTLTDHKQLVMTFEGLPLTGSERGLIKTLAAQSSHPLSKAIVGLYPLEPIGVVAGFQELVGNGIEGEIDGYAVRLGSVKYIFGEEVAPAQKGVFITIDGTYRGVYRYADQLRSGAAEIMRSLADDYRLSVISGDGDTDRQRIATMLGSSSHLFFNQSPKDKLDYIRRLQEDGQRVMMIGDGLNDAGALKQSDVGISIADDTSLFTPASDGILAADLFHHLYRFISYIKRARWVIYGAFMLAFMYNVIGLYFAVTGQLSPVIAAILMPLSSVTIIVYGVVMSHIVSKDYV